MNRIRIVVTAVTSLVVALVPGLSFAAAAVPGTQVVEVQASFSASFSLADIGRSELFVVEESGVGAEDQGGFGPFSYTSRVIQDLRRVPAGCGPNSSTGVAGGALLSFGDGDLRLVRRSGEACFAFPLVTASETWAVVSGTGPYRGATGALLRSWVGDVRTMTAAGTWKGPVRLVVVPRQI